MAKEITRAKRAYEKGLELYDALQALEVAKEHLADAEKFAATLEAEHAALVNGEPIAVTPPEEKRPRKDALDKVLAELDEDDAHAIAISLDDVKASILLLLRGSAGTRRGAGAIAKATGIDVKLVSKALAQMTDICRDGTKRAKVYWVDAGPVDSADVDLPEVDTDDTNDFDDEMGGDNHHD